MAVTSVEAQDVTLVRGSVDLTISAVVYALLDYKRGAKARLEKEYNSSGKYIGCNAVEDAEMIVGTIRKRSDQAIPPKFTVFSFDSKSWWIYDREESGSQPGLKQYAVEIIECPSGTVTLA